MNWDLLKEEPSRASQFGRFGSLHTESAPRREVKCRVIAVSGLASNPHWEWTAYSLENRMACNWLSELLPKQVRTALIETFRYNMMPGSIGGFLSVEGLTQAAERLLELIERSSHRNKSVPIVFVAHDLGGIVVKKALLMARENIRFQFIARACQRIIFFGTPHRALDEASWEDLLLGIVIASPAKLRIVPNMSTRLGHLAPFLEDLSQSFLAMSAECRFISVFQKPSDKSRDQPVIPPYSALMGVTHETILARPTRHEDLPAFSDDNNPVFQLIAETIQVESNPQYQDVARRISRNFPPNELFTSHDDDIHRFLELCQWKKSKYAEPEVITFLERELATNDSLFAYGEGALDARALYECLRSNQRPVVYFSLSDSNVQLQRPSAFWGSLILQIIAQTPGLYTHVSALAEVIFGNFSFTARNAALLFRRLIEKVAELVRDAGNNVLLYVVVENLPVNHPLWKKSVEYLQTLQGTAISDDLKTTVKRAVKVLWLYDRREIPDVAEEEAPWAPAKLVDPSTIFDRSPLQQFASALAAGLPSEEQRSKYRSLLLERCGYDAEHIYCFRAAVDKDPALLNSSHKDAWDGLASLLDKAFHQLPPWMKCAIGWLVYTKRPLTSEELSAAVRLSGHGTLATEIAASLRSQLGSLIHATSKRICFPNKIIRGHFRDAVKEENKNNAVNSATVNLPNDQIIADFLLALIPMKKGYSESSDATTGLRIYAMQFWRDHIRDAPFDVEKLVALSENDEFMQTREQLDYNNYWSKWKTAKTLAVEGPIALAAQVGLTNVVAKLAETTTSLRELGAAIATAARYGNGDMIDVLVKSDVLKSTRTLLPGIEAALEIACHHNAVSVLTPLLEYIKTSLGPPADDFAVLLSSLLCNAAKYGYTALMKLLVTTYGAQVDQSFDEKMRPLQQAIYYGHAKAARYLVEEAGAIIYENDSSDDDDDSLDSRSAVTENTDKNTNVLYIAAENGHTTIVELLLNNTIVRTESHTNGKSTASSDDSDTDHNNSSARKAVTNWSVIEDALVVACKKSHVDTAKHIFGHPAVSSVPASQRPFNIALLTAAVRAEVRPESKSLAMHIINSIMPSKRIADLIHPFVYAADNGQLEFVRYCLALDNLEATSALVNSAGDRGMKALNAAATKGNVDIVKCLLDRGADVNGLDSTQLTPLAQAAVAGHVETVKTLLENGADAAWIGSMSRGILASTVISAKCERAVDVVQLLLQAGAPVNALDRSKMTPLHLAARRGHLNILDVLLAQDGIDPTITGDRDMTALHSAAESSSRNAIRAALKLIAAGVGTQKQDVDGRLPLHIAASSWNGVDLVEFLLSKDQSSLNARTNNGDTVLHAAYKTCDTLIWLIDNGFDVDAENNEGKTTLMSAAERGVEESVGLLMSYGANTDMLDRSSRTALHHAVNAKNHSISNMLLDANPAVLFQLDSTGTSVLYTSISRGMREFALRSLDELEKYARAHKMEDQIVRVLDSVVSTTYRTPILLAARRSETKLVKRILQLGGSTDQRDYMGSSALYYAIDKGNEDMVRAILSMRPETAKGTADRYIANKDGVYRQGEGRGENGDDDDGDDDDSRDSSMRNDRFRNRSHPAALQSAAALGLVDMVKLLLSYGVDINEESGQLNTALTAAAAGGFTHVVRLLLEHGADTTLAGGSYPNALCAAVASTSPATIDALLAKDKTAVLARDVQGRNALHVAVQSRSLDAFEKILGVVESLSEGLEGMPYGSALDADKQGRRILHFAASAGDVDALRYFLEHPKLRLKDEIDILDNDGWTPLHWACRLTEGEECVDLLLDYKSDPNLETRDGWTPLNIAQYHDATGSVDLIETALRQRARQIFHRNAGAPTAASDRATDMAVDSNSQTHTHTHSHEEYDMKLEAGFLNWGVTCDGCLLMPTFGACYKCRDCVDYDLCFKCHWSAESTHYESHRWRLRSGTPDPGESRRPPYRQRTGFVEVEVVRRKPRIPSTPRMREYTVLDHTMRDHSAGSHTRRVREARSDSRSVAEIMVYRDDGTSERVTRRERRR